MYLIEGEKQPLYYLANYRTGSTAVGATLLNMGAKMIGDHHSRGEYCANAIVAANVRHPGDVIVSAWHKLGKPNWDEYLNTIRRGEFYFKPPTMFLDESVNYFLVYENLQFEFDMLCNIVGLPQTQLLVDHSPRPKDDPWQQYLSYSELESMFKEDLEVFGYTSEGLVGDLPWRW